MQSAIAVCLVAGAASGEHQIRVQTAVVFCFQLSVQVVQSKNLPPPYGKLANSVLRWPIRNKGRSCYSTENDSMQQFSHFFPLFVFLSLSAFSTSPPAFPLALASISNTSLSICLFFWLCWVSPLAHMILPHQCPNQEWWIGRMVQRWCVYCWWTEKHQCSRVNSGVILLGF